MECPLDSVQNDVQQLISRLKQRESTVNDLCNEIGQIQAQLSNIRQYQKEMIALYEASGILKSGVNNRPLHCLSAENREVEQLRVENRDLCESLDEHETAIDIVMNKYRLQMSNLVQGNHIDKPEVSEYPRGSDVQQPPEPTVEDALVRAHPMSARDRNKSTDVSGSDKFANSFLTTQIHTLTSVAKDVCDRGDAYSAQLEAELHRLRSENSGLREMLTISSDFALNESDLSEITRSMDARESEHSGYYTGHPQINRHCISSVPTTPNDHFLPSQQQNLQHAAGLSSLIRALDEFTPYEAAEREHFDSSDRAYSQSEDMDESDDDVTVADGSEPLD